MPPITCPIAQRLSEALQASESVATQLIRARYRDNKTYMEAVTLPHGGIMTAIEIPINGRWEARRFRIRYWDCCLTWFELEKTPRFPSEVHQWWVDYPSDVDVVSVLLRLE